MTDIEKINLFSRKTLTEDEVYTFTVKLCNNDVDRDFEKFSKEALGELAPMFVGKTGIFDHSMKSADQKARIYETFVEKEDGKTTLDGEDLYVLKARVYMLKNDSNKALIEEIEAGIKKEVSVSCSMNESLCSICGKDKRRGGCSHIGGRRYAGKLAFTVLNSPSDAYEFSFVAVPAQREAGVTKRFKTKGYDMDKVLDTIKSCAGEVTLTKAQASEINDYIENLRSGAELGEVYKKELVKDVTARLMLALPNVDGELLKSVTAVMTVKELTGFKNGLNAGMTPQLAPSKEKTKNTDYSQFRI